MTLDSSACSTENHVLFASQSFKGKAHIWWKTTLASKGRKKVYTMNWMAFRELLLAKYVPHNEVEKLENEYMHLRMASTEHIKYTARFIELIGLIPEFVGTDSKSIWHYIWGLVPDLRADVRTAKHATL
jgi:hypothetical protein